MRFILSLLIILYGNSVYCQDLTAYTSPNDIHNWFEIESRKGIAGGIWRKVPCAFHVNFIIPATKFGNYWSIDQIKLFNDFWRTFKSLQQLIVLVFWSLSCSYHCIIFWWVINLSSNILLYFIKSIVGYPEKVKNSLSFYRNGQLRNFVVRIMKCWWNVHGSTCSGFQSILFMFLRPAERGSV